MKNSKKILALMIITTAIFINKSYAEEYSTWITSTGTVESTLSAELLWIEYLDNSTMNVKLSWVNSINNSDSEIKILEDLKVASSKKDEGNSKKVIVTLPTDLISWWIYSLISIDKNLDASIDFVYNWEKEILNTVSWSTNYIEKIVLVDSKTLELNFKNDISSEKVDFTAFKELLITEFVFNVDTLSIKTKDPLLSNSKYILISNLKDNMGTDIEFKNDAWFYNFTTTEFAVPVSEELLPEVVNNLETTSITWSEIKENTTEVAAEVTSTPNTWSETTIAILLAMILWLAIYYFRSKKLSK